jgi:diguanylate cyclase (GGDEF)-like protein
VNSNLSCPLNYQDCTLPATVSRLQHRVSELEHQSETDALTGLMNFRAFERHLAREMERSRRLESPTSLIMLDIDHFKQVNDKYGHDMGNLALIHLAKLLTRALRKIDLACRFGGEEFALILPSTPLSAAIQVAERARKLIADSPLKCPECQIRLTASLGVNTYSPLDELTPAALIKATDQYLYQAKQTGRNCTHHPPVDRRAENTALDTREKQELFAVFGRRSKK